FEPVRAAMETPEPRVALGLELAGLATSAIDVSDGFAGDLAHILARSGVGARIDADALPAGADVAALPVARRHAWTLGGGDDYELVFTAAPRHREAVLAAGARARTAVTRVGEVTAAPGLAVHDAAGRPVPIPAGFDHFEADA